MSDLTPPPGLATPAASSSPDALLECLLAVARAHGRPLGRDAALAGLPLENHHLTPGLFPRAAKRAGLASNLVRRPLDELNPALFPVVLLLGEHDACVLLGWTDSGEARLLFPELPEAEACLPRVELEARYAGIAIFARPSFRFDGRAPEVGRVRRRHWFWGVLAENRPLYRDVLLAAGLINLLALALPLFTMNVYDRVVPNQATDTLWLLALGVALVVVADTGLRTLRGYFLDLASNRADVRLSSAIMERVLGLRLEERPLSTGAFAANLRSFETVRDFITSATVTAFVDLPFALLFLVAVAWIGWPLVFPILLGMAVVVIYGLSVQGKMHDLAETTFRASALRNATLIESLVGLESVKALGAEGLMQARWEKSAAFLARVSAQLRLLSSSALNGTSGIVQLVSVLVVVIGVYLIGERMLSMGGLIACTMLASRAMAPFGQVTGLLVQYHNASTALTSLNGIMQRPVERPDDAAFVDRSHFRGEIEFKDVSFQYPGQETNALRGVSFRLKAGERVAILGRVGSGKTTLHKLILGLFRPTSGAVLVDGVDIRQLDPAELRRAIGYVPQDITLFFGSLKDNLTIAAPRADDAAILRAARLGVIDEFVNAHPKGFEMMVGERGESLSGGQRQGVAIARALINDPPILLLDEPTGAMDHSTEEEIKRRLAASAIGKTMVIVTHRSSLLDLAERLIVVDGGRIVADGPKAQVMEALRQGRVGKAA